MNPESPLMLQVTIQLHDNTGWPKVELGDVCTKIGSGATPRGGKDVYLDEGPYTLIRSQNVYNDGFHYEGLAFIGEHHADQLQNVDVFETDVLLNITGDSVARVCQVARDVLPARVNQHVAIIRPDSVNLDAGYLRYYLASPEMQTMLLSWAGSGGTRNALTKGMIESLEIPLPPLPEQRRIASILGALDDKIELNRRIDETLEQMARALYKSWFVDFDPVRAKMDGRWRRGEPLIGLPAGLYDLFPDRLVESELGEIPEGWEVNTIGDLATIVGGSTPSTKIAEYWESGTHYWATPKDLSELTIPVLLSTNRKITDAGLGKIGSGLQPPGTVLMSSRAPVGYLAINEVPTAINQGFIAIKPKAGIPNHYLLQWCANSLEEILNYANGSTFLEISKSSFRSIRLATPNHEMLKAFDGLASNFHEKIVDNEQSNRILITIRTCCLLARCAASATGVRQVASGGSTLRGCTCFTKGTA